MTGSRTRYFEDLIIGEEEWGIEEVAVKTVHYEPVFIMVGVMYMISAISWLFINCTDSLDRMGPAKSTAAESS